MSRVLYWAPGGSSGHANSLGTHSGAPIRDSGNHTDEVTHSSYRRLGDSPPANLTCGTGTVKVHGRHGGLPTVLHLV